MAKHLKLTIKNTQIAEAINLGSLKDKLAKKQAPAETPQAPATAPSKSKAVKAEADSTAKAAPKEETPRVRARSKSVFAEGASGHPAKTIEEPVTEPTFEVSAEESPVVSDEPTNLKPKGPKKKTSEELRRDIFGDEAASLIEEGQPRENALVEKETAKPAPEPINVVKEEPAPVPQQAKQEIVQQKFTPQARPVTQTPAQAPAATPERAPGRPAQRGKPRPPLPKLENIKRTELPKHVDLPPRTDKIRLGPTGRHINDLYQAPKKVEQPKEEPKRAPESEQSKPITKSRPGPAGIGAIEEEEDTSARKGTKSPATKEFRDVKPVRRQEGQRTFDARDRHGLRATDTEEDQRWRKKRRGARQYQEEIPVIRPTTLAVRLPISIKDLASELKLKSSQLISKLFLQGLIVTLNDVLDDETTVQLLGQEFGCEISIDTSEEQRIRITDKTVKDEIKSSVADQLTIRPPVVAFMGHVDHGKTSLIDSIRKSNRAAGEAGAITQHIGAFRCHTSVGDIAILDTPGHEAFSAMRARGADVTDIVVLVVAGDEGIRQQTIEAIQHAKTAGVTIVVAINKADKPGFNPENVYRQLSEQELLPEAWGGQTLTVNCSAVTGEGIQTLLETLALQAEILELQANPSMRARGTVLESEMHKGMGSVATVLVQNGTLRLGDSLVFEQLWGRVKTMRNERGENILEASPSTPVLITGLSGLPEAGQEFIVVKTEREAKEIAEARMLGIRQSTQLLKKALTVENLLQQATPTTKKVLNVVIRADVQGSLEALKVALEKIQSTKAELNIIFTGVGEISETDIQLAATSKGVVLGFHTRVESHAEQMIKQLGVQVKLHDIIYHAIDDVKLIMTGMLDKIAQETDRGKAMVRALFKSSQVGLIAGCIVTEGTIQRNHHIRVLREGKVIGKAQISSLKRVKEDVREVGKGLECGIALTKFTDLLENDILEAYEITYITQEL